MPSRIPQHLVHLIVEQDYDRYDEQDQAVWRFVVMQTHQRLKKTAHAAYAPGFEAVGIRADRIPRISEINERLADLGWNAVCVDGFIPPRAFQAFQAASVLPIAAEIRTSSHLTYTPAPDIIHEAAGHAPFLAEPSYAHFLRRIGEVGRRAFSSAHDRDMYETIHTLSEVKEDPSSTPAILSQAEQAFADLSQRITVTSEAAKVARLYWWTVEYGLVGSLNQPKLYGAGLLSSIGEGHFCLDPEVHKLPLTASCVDVAYDITRVQPQLFVAEDFAALEHVLDDVVQGLSQTMGGLHGLRVACDSGELATLGLDSDFELSGHVAEVLSHHGSPYLVRLVDDISVAEHGAVLGELPRLAELLLPLGHCEDGTPLSSLSDAMLARRVNAQGQLELRTTMGVEIRGRMARIIKRDERIACVVLEDGEIHSAKTPHMQRAKWLPLVLASSVTTVSAGAPNGHEAPTAPSNITVPKPRTLNSNQREMVTLYERARLIFHTLSGDELESAVADIVARLDVAYPDDWLLRFHLLESLIKTGECDALQRTLRAELERLELHFNRREPIATGLAYLNTLTPHSPQPGDGSPAMKAVGS